MNCSFSQSCLPSHILPLPSISPPPATSGQIGEHSVTFVLYRTRAAIAKSGFDVMPRFHKGVRFCIYIADLFRTAGARITLGVSSHLDIWDSMEWPNTASRGWGSNQISVALNEIRSSEHNSPQSLRSAQLVLGDYMASTYFAHTTTIP